MLKTYHLYVMLVSKETVLREEDENEDEDEVENEDEDEDEMRNMDS